MHSAQNVASLLLGCLLAAAGCSSSVQTAAGPALAPLASQVLQPVQVPVERTVDGTIEAVNEATVAAQTGGRVAEILYDVGDVVPAGAVIVRIKGTEQHAALEAAQAALTEAMARRDEAVTSYQRIAGLFEQRVVSKAQLEQATANRDASLARVTVARAALSSASASVGYTEVRAPYGGVVTRRLVEVGETVAPGTPVMTGLSLQNLRVNTYIPQGVILQVRRLRKAAVYSGTQRLVATAITIFPEAAAATGTFRARLDLPPGALDVAPGMYVKVGLAIGEVSRLVIPASAVIERGEVTAVYVADAQGQVALRYVRPGRRDGDRLEILAGLAPGERLVLDPVAAAARVAQEGSAP